MSSVLELSGEGCGINSDNRILSDVILFCIRINNFLVSAS